MRPDRLACQFDILSPDTALLQVMKAGALGRHRLNVVGADERLTISSIDVAADRLANMASRKALVLGEATVPA